MPIFISKDYMLYNIFKLTILLNYYRGPHKIAMRPMGRGLPTPALNNHISLRATSTKAMTGSGRFERKESLEDSNVKHPVWTNRCLCLRRRAGNI